MATKKQCAKHSQSFNTAQFDQSPMGIFSREIIFRFELNGGFPIGLVGWLVS